MPTHRLATMRDERTPVRVQQWNATMRAGDDFKLALTVYTDDTGVPAEVTGSRSRLALWPDERRGFMNSPDYGWGWWTGATFGPGSPAQLIAGFVTTIRPGGINFAMPGSTTSTLVYGRYRLSVQVDLPDGEFSQVEGILQIREAWARPGLGHIVPLLVGDFNPDFNPDFAPDPNRVDGDGFYFSTPDFYPPGFGSVPGVGGNFTADFTRDLR